MYSDNDLQTIMSRYKDVFEKCCIDEDGNISGEAIDCINHDDDIDIIKNRTLVLPLGKLHTFKITCCGLISTTNFPKCVKMCYISAIKHLKVFDGSNMTFDNMSTQANKLIFKPILRLEWLYDLETIRNIYGISLLRIFIKACAVENIHIENGIDALNISVCDKITAFNQINVNGFIDYFSMNDCKIANFDNVEKLKCRNFSLDCYDIKDFKNITGIDRTTTTIELTDFNVCKNILYILLCENDTILLDDNTNITRILGKFLFNGQQIRKEYIMDALLELIEFGAPENIYET